MVATPTTLRKPLAACLQPLPLSAECPSCIRSRWSKRRDPTEPFARRAAQGSQATPLRLTRSARRLRDLIVTSYERAFWSRSATLAPRDAHVPGTFTCRRGPGSRAIAFAPPLRDDEQPS